jgi:SnoaL-like domain
VLNATLPSRADEAAILDLLAHYSACADRAPDARGWARCFTTDAVVRLFSRGRETPLVLTGRHAIEQAFDRVVPQCRQVHIVTNTVITLDGPTARIESCFARLDIDDETVIVGSFGRYHDVARRGRSLDWKLSARDIHIVARTASR